MDDFEDQRDLAKQIGEAISSPPLGTVVDDDELMAELEELEQEKLAEDLLNVEPIPQLPVAPQYVPAKAPVAAAAAAAGTHALCFFVNVALNLYQLSRLFENCRGKRIGRAGCLDGIIIPVLVYYS